MFGANRNYQLGFTDPETREMKWLVDFSIGEKLPSDQADVEVYRMEAGAQGESFLRLREDQLTFYDRMPPNRRTTEWRNVTRMTGTCSGEGVRVKLTDMPNLPELATIPIFIRSM